MAADTFAQLRHYQQEALIRAREQNIVMVGSTGVGKTLVALELLKDSDNYKNNRRAFFLTPTRHLAEQQYDRIVRGTWLKAEMIVGGEVEIWSKRKWQAIMAANEVIVCTAQILVNLLQKGSEYMSFDRISLLIFDECHRAGKKHSYVGVMNFYDPASSKPLPKVFGMTATPTEECFQLLQSVPHAEKQRLVNNDHMAQVGVEVLKLHRFIDLDDVALAREIEEFVNRQPGKRGVHGPKPIADLFESLVAAVFIDAGGSLEVVHDVLLPRLSHVPPITGKEGGSGNMDVDSTAPAAVRGAGPDGVCEGMTDLQKLHKMFPVTMSTCAVHYPKAVKSVIESWEEGLEEKKLQEEEEKEKPKPKPGRDERLSCA